MFFIRYVLLEKISDVGNMTKNIFYFKKSKMLLVLNNYTFYKELNSN